MICNLSDKIINEYTSLTTDFYNSEEVLNKALLFFSNDTKSNAVFEGELFTKVEDMIVNTRVFITRSGVDIIWSENPYSSIEEAIVDFDIEMKISMNPSNSSLDDILNYVKTNYPDYKIPNYTNSYNLLELIGLDGISPTKILSGIDLLNSFKTLEDSIKVQTLEVCDPVDLKLEIPSSEEIHKISEDYCACEDCEPAPEEEIEEPYDTEEEVLDEQPLYDLLDAIEKGVQDIADCSIGLNEATNQLFYWKEVKMDLEILKEYFSAKSEASDNLSKNLTTLYTLRSDLESKRNALDPKKDTLTIADLNTKINEVYTKIDDFNKTNKIPVLQISDFGTAILNPTNLFNFFKSNTAKYRKNFTDINSMTNMIGWSDEFMKIFVPAGIKEEFTTLFETYYKNTESLKDFVGSYKKDSLGLLQQNIWNKFYSTNRIDELFTYKEQGFLSPKPTFSSSGSPTGPKVTKEITLPDGTVITQDIDQNIANLEVDQDIADDFWTNLQKYTEERIDLLIGINRNSDQYKSFIEQIKSDAEDEVRYFYALDKINTGGVFDSVLEKNFKYFSINGSKVSSYYFDYLTISQLLTGIDSKIASLKTFMQNSKDCADNKTARLGDLLAPSAQSGGDAQPTKNCGPELGKHGKSQKLFTDGCPSLDKNCYWKEYTKILQKASIMPIIDIPNITKRLFRYYPVAIQCPSPVPLPTLASGIPDALISIPVPFIWKHLISVSTPMGVLVIWLAFAGPIPSPFVMLIDESGEPMFMATMSGKTKIPDSSLGATSSDKKTLLDTLLSKGFKLPSGFIDGIFGSIDFNMKNADSFKNFVSKIRKDISDSINNIKPLPSINNEKLLEKKKKLSRLKNGDLSSFEYLKTDVKESLASFLDKVKISGVAFPSDKAKSKFANAKLKNKLALEKLKANGVKKADLGITPKKFDLKQKIKHLANVVTSSADFTPIANKIDEKIAANERSGKIDTDKIKTRKDLIKETVVQTFKIVLDNLTPEKLGIPSVSGLSISNPFKCYQAPIKIPTQPSILAAIAAAKAVQSIIESYDVDELISMLGLSALVKAPLSLIKDIVGMIVNSVVKNLIPAISFIETNALNLKSLLSDGLKSIKSVLRLPRIGIPDLTIDGNQILNLVKSAILDILTSVFDNLYDTLLKSPKAFIAQFKAMFGCFPEDFDQNAIKSFLLGTIDESLNSLSALSSIIDTFSSAPKIDFKSIKNKFLGLSLKSDDSATAYIKQAILKKLIDGLFKVYSNLNIPYVLFLQTLAVPGMSKIMTKIHPYVSYDAFPQWEKLSTDNLPFMVWVDWFLYTAQKHAGLGSDYIAPYRALI